MPRLIAALTLSLTLAAPVVARAEGVPAAHPRPAVARHYRGLEKLLKRFRLEAGSRAHEGRELADARPRG